MATYTMYLHEVVEHLGGREKLPLGDYPIYDEDYRETLNNKIIEHFWNEEIGQETISLFVHTLRRKMNEIMPVYNKLYLTQALIINPLLTFRSTSDVTNTGTTTADSTSESFATNDTVSDAKSRSVSSETPQEAMSPTGEYATGLADSTSASTGKGTASDTSKGAQSAVQDSSSHSTTEGFSGSQSALLLEYRQTIMNIDMDVIAELDVCFMQVWDNGDAFTESSRFYNGFGGYPAW